jgi:hypothetical protein
VLFKNKTVEGAHVVVKNVNGTMAGSCYTGPAGDCKVSIGPDSYVIGVTSNGRAGALSLRVTESTGQVEIKLARMKAESAP